MRASSIPRYAAGLLVTLSVGGAACGGGEPARALLIGGIPDQDFVTLEERFGGLADYLSERVGVPVEYAPADDYAAVVTAFEHGDVLLGWFGGLTGVQARRAVEGAEAVAQRPEDTLFQSVFIVNADQPADSLPRLAGRSFTFGSESSTSGHLMPRHFLLGAGVDPAADFEAVNYSGSHDATWQLVQDGVWDAGALNRVVWSKAVEAGEVDTTRVRVVTVTEPYFDYHWVVHPGVDDAFGTGTTSALVAALLSMHEDPEGQGLLDLFGTDRFIPTENANYVAVERVADRLGLLGER